MSQHRPPDELAIVHPGDDATLGFTILTLGGTALFLFAQLSARRRYAPSQRTPGPIGLATKNGTATGQPVVQGRSFSGFRTAQMCLIRSPATSNATTVTVTPAC